MTKKLKYNALNYYIVYELELNNIYKGMAELEYTNKICATQVTSVQPR